ncbi:hypothetical protein [Streptomyces olivaceus]|uniref:hypothetical protein n=1 Tax=Streptomyces olivaceus TaxID=47716 RepID=UPI00405772DF
MREFLPKVLCNGCVAAGVIVCPGPSAWICRTPSQGGEEGGGTDDAEDILLQCAVINNGDFKNYWRFLARSLACGTCIHGRVRTKSWETARQIPGVLVRGRCRSAECADGQWPLVGAERLSAQFRGGC